MVAFTTLCGLLVRKHLLNKSLIPTASRTARTAPPAMSPVPLEAGRNSTRPDPKQPITSCGIGCPASQTSTIFFLAFSTPFRMASGTSFALPRPQPTFPSRLPTTTRALKLNRRPPLTTLATRLILTTLSINSCLLSLGSCNATSESPEVPFQSGTGTRI